MNYRFIVPLIFMLIFTIVPKFLYPTLKKAPLISHLQDTKLRQYDRIGILLNNIEKTSTYPKSLVVPGRRPPMPRQGNIYLVIHFTVDHINNVHLGMAESILVGANSSEYKMNNLQYSGIKMNELKGGYEITQGATGIMVFEIPTDMKLLSFKFIYTYWESWENKVIKYGQIDFTEL